MIQLDARLSDRMRIAEQPGPLRTLAVILAHSGDSWFWLAGLLILYAAGSGYWKSRALVMIIAILVTAALVFLVKLTVRRKRPQGEWGKFYRSTDPHSFPSGHAVRTVMLAVVCLGLGPLWLGIVLLVWAPFVSLARVAMGVHYLSDVVVGMVLGAVIGGFVLLAIRSGILPVQLVVNSTQLTHLLSGMV